MNNNKSYLFLDKERNIRINSIKSENLTISQIIPTIERMYINGANDMDNRWRKAIKIYAEKHNIPFAPGMINEIFNILNSI